MAVTKSPGTENLRADPHVYRGTMTEPPSKSGKDAGGTSNLKADHKVKRAESKQPQTYSRDNRPAGVQNFSGMAKEGGR